jgi:hypothetical protein
MVSGALSGNDVVQVLDMAGCLLLVYSTLTTGIGICGLMAGGRSRSHGGSAQSVGTV